MDKFLKALKLIQKQVKGFKEPSVTRVSRNKDPYRILISCILSLRTKDKTTDEASARLFRVAADPMGMARIPSQRLEKLIYPVGFYRNKARVILGLSKKLIEDFKGRVPDKLEELLALKGVGRKTANLVLGLAYNIPAICVDTHVHRISNRLGWVKTTTPQATEEALENFIPERHWIDLNTWLVTFGQNICAPISPFCSSCLVRKYCKRIGVRSAR